MFGTAVNWSYDWEYWGLYHKVTFDGPNKLILINSGVTEIDWKEDVYSAWKEWVMLNNHLDNPGYLDAISVIGGENITTDGSRKVGTTFFLKNGWRIKPWAGDYRLVINGNVYTEEGVPIYIPIEGSYKIIIEQTLSQLVQLVTTESGETIPVEVPSSAEIADAVWNRMATNHISTGTFGAYVNMIKATTDLQLAESYQIKALVNTSISLIETLSKYETNRTRVDQAQKRLYIYDNDGTTVLKVFDLRDFNGTASVTQIAERIPVP